MSREAISQVVIPRAPLDWAKKAWLVGRPGVCVCLAIAASAVGLSFGHHFSDKHFPALLAQRIGTADQIIVDKSERRLWLVSGGRELKAYRVALGANPRWHKEIVGDSRTPEGDYTIDWRKPDSQFHRALHISYPNQQDRAFAAAIRRLPGNAIMIHGQANDLGWFERLTRASDWTNGCIAVSNREMEEIWHAVPDGTPITIRP
jgi:murein L,D-transpeptidase YafK